jgi:hypothetical protein
MANTIVTHPAQKLKIKHIRGSNFKLVVNIKNADGTNYDFTSNPNDSTESDTAIFQVFGADGEGIIQNWELGAPLPANSALDCTVEDGKITVDWVGLGQPFAVNAGRYKYTLISRKSSLAEPTLSESSAQTVWLYGDFIVEDIQPYTNTTTYGL